MMLGFPMPVEQAEDHATRLKCLADFVQQRQALHAPMDQVALGTLRAHMQAHLQALARSDPKAARQAAAGLGRGITQINAD